MLQDKFNLFFKTSNTYDGEMKKNILLSKVYPSKLAEKYCNSHVLIRLVASTILNKTFLCFSSVITDEF